MARLEVVGTQPRGKWCSYKRSILAICSINIVIGLYVLRSIYGSLYLYPSSYTANSIEYTSEQLDKMEESMRIRKDSEPLQLIKVVKELQQEFAAQESVSQVSWPVKEMIRNEILEKLRSLPNNADISMQSEAIEHWRREKLQEVHSSTLGKNQSASIISQDEAGILLQALEFNWPILIEEIGVFIPSEFTNKEHDDKPEGVELVEDPLPGLPVPSECNAELHTDYGGAAVKWGLTHHKESAADCCQACLDQAQRARPGEMKCNIWVYCPSEDDCYSPDIYRHKNQECWLKYAHNPEVNFKDKYSEEYRSKHPRAPVIVPWVSGVIRA